MVHTHVLYGWPPDLQSIGNLGESSGILGNDHIHQSTPSRSTASNNVTSPARFKPLNIRHAPSLDKHY